MAPQIVFRAQRRTGIGTGMGRAYALDTWYYRFQLDDSSQWVTCPGTQLILHAESAREVEIDDPAAPTRQELLADLERMRLA